MVEKREKLGKGKLKERARDKRREKTKRIRSVGGRERQDKD